MAGVAMARDYTTTELAQGSSTALESVELVVPGPGHVVVYATFYAALVHATSGGATGAYFNVNTAEFQNSVGTGVAWLTGVPTGAATGTYFETVTIHQMFPVADAGPVAFYLVGQGFATGGTVSVDQMHVTATYFPTAYGGTNQ